MRFEDLLNKQELQDWELFNKEVVPKMSKKGYILNFLPYHFKLWLDDKLRFEKELKLNEE